jgi:uncharacterized membrane protein YeiH
MLYVLDIFGTFVFALSGAFRAVKYELGLLGVLVLATATGVGGGILRDLLLGVAPPSAFQDEAYLLICIVGGLLVFVAAPRIAPLWDWVMLADAIGLGVFAALGAARGAEKELGWVGVVMMAAMTATGGGVIRDVLVLQVPAVLKNEFYASAAILGGAGFVAARALGVRPAVQLIVCMSLTCLLRLLAMRYKIALPRVKSLPASPSELAARRRGQG